MESFPHITEERVRRNLSRAADFRIPVREREHALSLAASIHADDLAIAGVIGHTTEILLEGGELRFMIHGPSGDRVGDLTASQVLALGLPKETR